MNTECTARTIRVIPAFQFASATNHAKRKQLVCAYARVSTDKEDQLNSYNTQCDYYNEKLSKDPNITYIGLYADEGITGTKMRRRKDFLRMIEDCRAGKITRIITKSVQRFARNTAECLTIARELKDKGVTILFETNSIDTTDDDAWLKLSIMATLAEEESRTTSHNITWAYQKKFERGEYAGSGKIYGYKIKKNKFTIIEKEALVIQRIYEAFLQGKTINAIKRELEENNIPTPHGKAKWQFTTIRNILSNEKYKGDLLLQKTYKADVLCDRRLNNGAKPQYFIQNNHLPIISQEQFDAVQIELKKREKKDNDEIGTTYSNDYAFSSKIECGECGTKFRRHAQWRGSDKSRKIPIWVCLKHQLHHDECSMKPIKEVTLEQGFVEALQLLTSQRKDIIERVRQNINTVIEKPDFESLENMIESLENKQQELVLLSTRTSKPTEAESAKSAQLVAEIKALQEQIQIAKHKTDNVSILQYRMKEIDKMLKGTYTTFDKNICKNLLEKIIIKDKHTATYIFKCGIAIDQEI